MRSAIVGAFRPESPYRWIASRCLLNPELEAIAESTLYTQHPTPYTPHPTPYTPHPTPLFKPL
ncbi:MAG: hypothetical protein F6J93_33920 [Oscillatoria sp. SIO1A7]|nr:hypothetical protein [Oscillatoria sp. SIO1A7]